MGQSRTFAERMTICVERLTESGVAALGGLFDLTSQRLVRYATTITRNQHDAEDAVQAALVLVAKKLRKFCQADQPWPYLLRMVRNESLLIARRKKRWTLSSNLADLFSRQLVDEVEMEETFRAVWSALRSLPCRVPICIGSPRAAWPKRVSRRIGLSTKRFASCATAILTSSIGRIEHSQFFRSFLNKPRGVVHQ